MQDKYINHYHGSGFVGAILIAVGLIFLLTNFEILPQNVWFYFWRLWPVILILLGLQILFAHSRIGSFLMTLLGIIIVAAAAIYAISQADPHFNLWLQQLLLR